MAIESTIEQNKAGTYHNANCSAIPGINMFSGIGQSSFQFLIQHQAPADPYAILLLVLLFGMSVRHDMKGIHTRSRGKPIEIATNSFSRFWRFL